MTATTTELDELVGRSFTDHADDLHRVLQFLMVGQPYLYGRQSYGGEQRFHLGVNRPYGHPKLVGQTRGSHVVSTRGSAWELKSGTRLAFVSDGLFSTAPVETISKPLLPAVLESGAFVAAGATVLSAAPIVVSPRFSPPGGFGLLAQFSDGSSLMILPVTVLGSELIDLPDWEVLTPAGHLSVGPGAIWTLEADGRSSTKP